MAIELSNGVILPDIPVLDTCPYSVIYKVVTPNDNIINYSLIQTSKKVIFISSELSGEDFNSIGLRDEGIIIAYDYDSTLNQWTQIISTTGSGSTEVELYPIHFVDSSSSFGAILWANYDIMVAEKDAQGKYVETNIIASVIETQIKYNNITLPSLPFDETGTYLYNSISSIYTNEAWPIYCLIASSVKGLYIPPRMAMEDFDEDLIEGLFYINGNFKMYACAPERNLDSWILAGTYSEETTIPSTLGQILWSDYDIMVATKDEKGNYIASDTIYDYIVDMVEYNGVILPELPHSELQYAVILDGTKSSEVKNNYILILSDVKVCCFPTEYGIQYDTLFLKGKGVVYLCPPGGNNWIPITKISSEEGLEELPLYEMFILWSDYDIMKVIPMDDEEFLEIGIYYPPVSTEPLPDIEHKSNYYTVSADFISDIANQARRFSNNYVRMTPEKIVDAFVNSGSYQKVFDKTIEEIDFELPPFLYPCQFLACSKLTSLSNEKPIAIGAACFAYCTSLQTVSLSNAKYIESDAFQSCTSLTDVSLPKVTELPSTIFQNCPSLTNIDTSNITSIEYSAFRGCSNLNTVNLDKVIYLGPQAFENCSSLVNINMPKAIEIGNLAFENCTNLTIIDLGSCISIGSTDYSYASQVFYDCTNLVTLILRSPKKCTLISDNYVFYNTPIASGTGYIYVPSALLDSYKTDNMWSTYAAQFRAIEDYPDICGNKPIETIWTNGDKDITSKLQHGAIKQYQPYIYDDSACVSYIDFDLVVNGGETISVEVPDGYKFRIYTLSDYSYTSALQENTVYYTNSDWIPKGNTYNVPTNVSGRPVYAIWITFAKENLADITPSDLGTVIITKTID